MTSNYMLPSSRAYQSREPEQAIRNIPDSSTMYSSTMEWREAPTEAEERNEPKPFINNIENENEFFMMTSFIETISYPQDTIPITDSDKDIFLDRTQVHMRIYHAACEHEVRQEYRKTGVQFCTGDIGTQQEIELRLAEPAFFVVHPRWCAECLQSRYRSVVDSFDKQLAEIDASERGEDERGLALEYLQHCLEARMEVIGTSLDTYEDMLKEGTGDEDDGMTGLMEGLNVDGEDEAFARSFGNASMEWDEDADKRKREQELCEMRMRGKRDGTRHQARLETEALHTRDRVTRRRLFEEALL